MSTISASLKYLEENGYITLQSEKFKGIKARVIRWGDYQATTRPVAESDSPPTLRGVDNYAHSSRWTTPQVVTRAPHPYGSKAFSADKMDIKNSIKTINPVVVTVAENFAKEFGRSFLPWR